MRGSRERVVGKTARNPEEVGNSSSQELVLFPSLPALSPPLQPPLIQGKKAEVTRTCVFQLLLGCYFQPGPASGWHQAMRAQGQHVLGLLAHVKTELFSYLTKLIFRRILHYDTLLISSFLKWDVHVCFKKGLIFDSGHHTVITILDGRKIYELPYQVTLRSCLVILVLWWHQEV